MSRRRVQPPIRAQCLTRSRVVLARAAIMRVDSSVVSYSSRATAMMVRSDEKRSVRDGRGSGEQTFLVGPLPTPADLQPVLRPGVRVVPTGCLPLARVQSSARCISKTDWIV